MDVTEQEIKEKEVEQRDLLEGLSKYINNHIDFLRGKNHSEVVDLYLHEQNKERKALTTPAKCLHKNTIVVVHNGGLAEQCMKCMVIVSRAE